MTFALDSWAVLSLLEGTEPAAARVQTVLSHRPVMSWINMGEVFYVVQRARGADDARSVVRDLEPHLSLDLPTRQRVLDAARIKAGHAMAYADAFAAATAVAHDATLLTGDPELLLPGAPWRFEDLRAAVV